MSKYYEEPVVEIRSYKLADNVFTESNPSSNNDNDLNNDDEYDYFGNN